MKGLDIAKSLIDEYAKKRQILLYGDPDPDGLFSLKFMVDLVHDVLGITDYMYYVNERRAHGFMLKPSTLKGYLVIAADFEIDRKTMQTLVDNDVVIVSLDHHKCENEFIDVYSEKTGCRGVVINNQYPFEPEDERYNSGAGVCYEAFKEMYPEFDSPLRKGIVGITLLSDTRPLENDKARAYLKSTFSLDTQVGYAHYLVESTMTGDFAYGVPKLDRNFIDYTLSPRLNSLLRFNKLNEAIKFVLGQGISSENTQAKQTGFLGEMKKRAGYLYLSNVTCIYVDTRDFSRDYPDVDLTCFIGLLCSHVKGNNGNSVLGFVVDNGKVVRASFRGRFADINYMDGFISLGYDAQGHPPAFGIKGFEPTQQSWIDINEMVAQREEYHKQTINVVEVSNLAFYLNQRGYQIAQENCYVRDLYRSYIRYTGTNITELQHTYQTAPMEPGDLANGVEPADTSGKTKYVLDENGNKISKYIVYNIDGKTAKSFGVEVKDGLILPILERGYVALYVRENIE